MRVLEGSKMFGFPSNIFYDATVIDVLSLADAEEQFMLSNKDILCIFGGGQDVHPQVYNNMNVASVVPNKIPFRDYFEWSLFNLCQMYEVPMLGICRGAQFLCAMSGGSLIQDVAHHAGAHMILDIPTGKIYQITSTHHQMMYPFDLKAEEYTIIAEASPARSRGYYVHANHELRELPCEPEIVYFKNTRALCVQGHPEYMEANHETVQYIRKLVRDQLEVF